MRAALLALSLCAPHLHPTDQASRAVLLSTLRAHAAAATPVNKPLPTPQARAAGAAAPHPTAATVQARLGAAGAAAVAAAAGEGLALMACACVPSLANESAEQATLPSARLHRPAHCGIH